MGTTDRSELVQQFMQVRISTTSSTGGWGASSLANAAAQLKASGWSKRFSDRPPQAVSRGATLLFLYFVLNYLLLLALRRRWFRVLQKRRQNFSSRQPGLSCRCVCVFVPHPTRDEIQRVRVLIRLFLVPVGLCAFAACSFSRVLASVPHPTWDREPMHAWHAIVGPTVATCCAVARPFIRAQYHCLWIASVGHLSGPAQYRLLKEVAHSTTCVCAAQSAIWSYLEAGGTAAMGSSVVEPNAVHLGVLQCCAPSFTC